MRTIVVALGGNAILQRGEKGTAEEQRKNVKMTASQIASLVKDGYRVVITHGNGPQVGNILIQNEVARGEVPAMPMDICGAESQGMIGYMMQMSIRNALREIGLDIPVVTVVTQTLVDRQDPAFLNPTKPVGPFYDERWARERQEKYGETWVEDSGRGWRRVVPSPDPKLIIEGESIKALVDKGHIVISTGGGGIPVIQDENGVLSGVEAVIDKDLGAERLAVAVGADTLMILTDVNGAAINYGTTEERWLGKVTLSELKKFEKEGHFKKGSMGPKVAAIIRFLEHGGEQGIIASLDKAIPALRGETGTLVVPG
ncbi:MAG: carbamate kinase [Candidatus Fermentithermobacillus carboniphilus]|uniref:Carbamate kinase n=1 Tax=Candidatus Fermentithermobacillus carboniphilus TaxID=3085328 RepID=A0AAT9LER4_9FIRM|nr:MAG: carbamate kinase [Candidatus Fermentithermobacillus carboniphilus]